MEWTQMQEKALTQKQGCNKHWTENQEPNTNQTDEEMKRSWRDTGEGNEVIEQEQGRTNEGDSEEVCGWTKEENSKHNHLSNKLAYKHNSIYTIRYPTQPDTSVANINEYRAWNQTEISPRQQDTESDCDKNSLLCENNQRLPRTDPFYGFFSVRLAVYPCC